MPTCCADGLTNIRMNYPHQYHQNCPNWSQFRSTCLQSPLLATPSKSVSTRTARTSTFAGQAIRRRHVPTGSVRGLNDPAGTGIPAQGTGGHALEHGQTVPVDPANRRTFSLRWHSLRIYQSQLLSSQVTDLGWHRGLVVPSPFAQGAIPLAESR